MLETITVDVSQGSLQRFVEGACLAAHDHLPVCDMVYSEINGLWATATHNEIAFIRWKPSSCECRYNEVVLTFFFKLSL